MKARFLQGVPLFLALFVSHGQAQVTVTVYEHANYQGAAKQVSVNRCENILDFNDRASSIRTSGCVILYDDACCLGSKIQINIDNPALVTFNDRTTSLSPCGNYRAPLPNSIRETWLGHGQTMRKVIEDGDIAIYYNDQVNGRALQNHREYLKKMWAYVKRSYGDFGPEGGRLSAFMHANVQNIPGYGFNSIQNYFDLGSSCRNLLDLVSSGPNGWSSNLTGYELDALTHEASHIVEGASKGVHFSPAYNLWGDSKWAEIFIYDVYNALGMTQERDRFYREVEGHRENFPRPNTYWFRNWFYPIYQQNGGVRVLNNYFNLVAQYFPRKSNGWEYVNRAMNLGELVHFFSGAAGRDLKSQAMRAFAWDDSAERELQKAKVDFPIRY